MIKKLLVFLIAILLPTQGFCATQTINGIMTWPQEVRTSNRSPTIQTTNLVIDAASEQAAGVFQSPKTGTIDKICFRTGTVTTGATVDVRLETVSITTGDPSGTLFGTTTNASQVIADANDNVWFTVDITDVSTTKGDWMAITVVNSPSTPGNMQIANTDGSAMNGATPYIDLFTTVWAKAAFTPCMAVEYTSASYAPLPGVIPSDTVGQTTYASDNATQDETGILFQVPFPCRVTGIWLYSDIDAADDFDVVLYDSSNTVILTNSFDANVRRDALSNNQWLMFSSTAVLAINSNYRIIIKPTTTNALTVNWYTVKSSDVLGATSGGANWYWTQRVDAGAWTDTNTKVMYIGLLLDGFDDAVGGTTNDVFGIM